MFLKKSYSVSFETDLFIASSTLCVNSAGSVALRFSLRSERSTKLRLENLTSLAC